MSSQSYYETLGIAEGATFEEIQSARTKLSAEHAEDSQRLQQIEKAYDALLMERLRLRQEGKITVPDGVRFAEDKPAVSAVAKPKVSLPTWNTNFSDTPELWDWVAPSVAYVALIGLTIVLAQQPQTLTGLAGLGAGAAIFFIYRKEQKILRAIAWGLGGVILGAMVGVAIAKPLIGAIPALPSLAIVQTWITFIVLWMISVFLK